MLRDFGNLTQAPVSNDEASIEAYAQSRLDYARSLQEAFTLFESLVRGAVLIQNFTESDLQDVIGDVNSIRGAISSELLSLNSALEDLRSGKEGKKMAILSAENKYRSAQISYEKARSSAASQETSRQNQLRAAQVSQNDLILRAPFSGIVSKKFVNSGATVKSGQNLLRLTNPSATKKAAAFVSASEYQRMQGNPVLIEVGDQSFEISPKAVNAQLDTQSQKMEVRFNFPEEFQDTVLVGQLGKMILPANGFAVNLLPLSAISFEPDGAEVLVVNEENMTERRKIQVGKLKSDAIEVVSGLTEGDIVVEYRNRSYAGQEVNTLNP